MAIKSLQVLLMVTSLDFGAAFGRIKICNNIAPFGIGIMRKATSAVYFDRHSFPVALVQLRHGVVIGRRPNLSA